MNVSNKSLWKNTETEFARLSDVPAIFVIEKDSFPSEALSVGAFSVLIDSLATKILVYREPATKEISGYCLLFLKREARVYSIAVSKEARGLGVGQKLLLAAFWFCKHEGYDKIILEVRQSNEGALGLYKKLGFTEVKMLPAYYLDGESAVSMVRPLT